VIKSIQDAIYGSRHCYVEYVELHSPDFAGFCESLQVKHVKRSDSKDACEVLGPVKAKFSSPPEKKEEEA
jgi:acetolactate synthase-1/2/3 large subunit